MLRCVSIGDDDVDDGAVAANHCVVPVCGMVV